MNLKQHTSVAIVCRKHMIQWSTTYYCVGSMILASMLMIPSVYCLSLLAGTLVSGLAPATNPRIFQLDHKNGDV